MYSNLPKNEPNLWRIFALVSNMGKIKKIRALSLLDTPDLSISMIMTMSIYLSFIWPIFEARIEIRQKFGSIFGIFEGAKIPFWD